MKIVCKTLFDCTYTGVTGSFKPSQVPFRDRAGHEITNQTQWNRSRNQQRNWETILQIVSLNTQPHDIVLPTTNNNTWQFEFHVESGDVFGLNNNADPLAGLKQNCAGVPMIAGLDENSDLDPVLAPGQNIWFDAINIGLE